MYSFWDKEIEDKPNTEKVVVFDDGNDDDGEEGDGAEEEAVSVDALGFMGFIAL